MLLKSQFRIGVLILFIYKEGDNNKQLLLNYLCRHYRNFILKNNLLLFLNELISIICDNKHHGYLIKTIPFIWNANNLCKLKHLLLDLYLKFGCFTNLSCSIHFHISIDNLKFFDLGCMLYNFIDKKCYMKLKTLKINLENIIQLNLTYSNIVNMKKKYYYNIKRKFNKHLLYPFEFKQFTKNSFCLLRLLFLTIEYRSIRGIFDIQQLSLILIKNRVLKYIYFINIILDLFCNIKYDYVDKHNIIIYKLEIRHSS